MNSSLFTLHSSLRVRTPALILISFLFPLSVLAASFNDAADGPWNGCETWGTCPGAVEGTDYPGTTDDVTIDSHTVTLSGAFAVNDLVINPEGTLSVDEGLVGYWKFDEGAGTSTTADASGNDNHLTLNGMEEGDWTDVSSTDITRFYNPYALSFDGTSSEYAKIDSILGLTKENVTMAMWVNLDSTSEKGAFIKIGSNNGCGGGSDGFGFGVGSNNVDTNGNDLIGLYECSRWIDTNTAIGTGWHHLAMTIDESGYPELYIDGASVYSDTIDDPIALDSHYETRIGGYTVQGNQRYSDAILDDVRVYDRPLLAKEIAQLAQGRESHVQFSVDGSWENNDGTFNPGYGTVIMKSTSNESIKTGGDAFHNLDIEDPQEPGLVGYWKLDEGEDNTCSGGEDACDSSGNGNHGTINGGDGDEWVASGTGTALFYNPYAMDFDGSDDYVSTPLLSVSTTSIAVWVKADAVDTNYEVLVGADADASNRGYILSKGGQTNQKWNFFLADRSEHAASSADITTSWTHVVGVHTGNEFQLYVNGALVDTQSSAYSVVGAPTYSIGRRDYTGFNQYFAGSLDDVRIYNYALTDEQISRLSEGGYASPNLDDGLIGYWKFDEGTGTVAEDFSGLNNSGSLVNMDESDWVTTTQTLDYANPYALDFDGDNDYVNAGDHDSLEPDLPLTFAFWANADSNSVTNTAISLDSWGNTYYGAQVVLNSEGSISISYGDGTGGTSSDRRSKKGGSYSAGTWHNVIAVLSGPTDIKIYIDGEDVGGAYSGGGGTIAYSSNPTVIGAATTTPTLPFEGVIDDVRVYARALTGSEITALANGGNNSTTFTLTGDLDVDGTLSFHNAALAADDNVSVAGDWNNFAGVYSFEANASTVTLDGASQTFRGMGNTFHTLIKQGANDGSNDAMTMAASGTYIVTDTFKVHGASDTDITAINSSNTSYDWHLFADNVNLQRMSVANSLNMETQKDINAIHQTDGGGNTGWCFASCTKGRAMWFFGF